MITKRDFILRGSYFCEKNNVITRKERRRITPQITSPQFVYHEQHL